MLPTLLFIFGAYSLYALYILWSRHRRKSLRRERRGARSSRLLWGGGAAVLAGLILLAARLSPPAPHHTLRLAGVLGGAEPGLITAKAELAPEKLPVAKEVQGDHPAYALLHPETPPILMPENPAFSSNPARKPKAKRAVKGEVHRSGMASKPAIREKPANNLRTKKKKPKNAIKPTPVGHAYSFLIQ